MFHATNPSVSVSNSDNPVIDSYNAETDVHVDPFQYSHATPLIKLPEVPTLTVTPLNVVALPRYRILSYRPSDGVMVGVGVGVGVRDTEIDGVTVGVTEGVVVILGVTDGVRDGVREGERVGVGDT